MKWKNSLSVLGSALLVLVFLVYLGIQVSSNLSEQIITVDATEVTVEDRISAEGAFLREQVPVPASVSGGWAEYLVEEGEKVAAGAALAVYFSSESAARQYADCQNLRDDLAALRYAYESITGGADSVKMDELIWRQIVAVNGTLDGGQAARSDAACARLEQLVVSRSASREDKSSFESQIATLESELSSRESALSGNSSTVSAPCSGYFLSSCDGYGELLSPSRRDVLTPEELLESELPAAGGTIGCIVDSFEWYFAAVVDRKDGDVLRELQTVDVYFSELSSSAATVRVESVRTCEDGRAVVLLRSAVMDAQYLGARRQTADLVATRYTGIRVPRDALRQLNGVWGVYVLDGSVSRFKPVEWVYQTDSYYLVPCAASADDGLYRYDKIIVSARGLEDNKVLK